MNSRRDFAAGAGHAAISQQRHAVALVLQNSKCRGQAVQFRHAIRVRSLETHDHDYIAVELACLESSNDIFLCMEHGSRRFDGLAILVNRAGLVDAPPSDP